MASPLIVGVDVSKASLHVAFVAPGKTQATFLNTFPNEPTAFDALLGHGRSSAITPSFSPNSPCQEEFLLDSE